MFCYNERKYRCFMSFLTFSFSIFLLIVFIFQWLLPPRLRWISLLCASVFFFSFVAYKFLPLLLVVILISWIAAIKIEKSPNLISSRILYLIAIFLPLLALLFYKYIAFIFDLLPCGFLGQNFKEISKEFSASLVLPLGISFWTFSILSYLFDVKHGKIKAERNLGLWATYVLYFPKLVSGPIERADTFLGQVSNPQPFSYNRAVYGLRQFALGLFRKVVIADYLATFTDVAFNQTERFGSGALVLSAFFYSIQIYNDFAGYSDMAIGTSRLLGIDLQDNFRSPYFARSLKEFWSRWHISLSTWFRDYLYFPMGGSRCCLFRARFNLIATFLVSGLWHGANLTFVVWGLVHGIVQAFEKTFTSVISKRFNRFEFKLIGNFMGWLLTFSIVTLAWIFFRCESFNSACIYIKKMTYFVGNPLFEIKTAFQQFAITPSVSIRLFLPMLMVAIWDFIALKHDPFKMTSQWNLVFRWILHLIVISIIIYVLLPMGSSSKSFIYFQF